MLQGFAVPLTPQGNSPLASLPPWHYSSDCLAVEFWTDPARYQYREAFVLVEALFERTPINYCPYIFVDNDAAIARGWAQGFPKKYGSIYQTRSFSAPSGGRRPSREGQPVRRQRCVARRAIGDGASADRGEGYRSYEGVQPADGDAPVFPAARRGGPEKAADR
jgi:hypothetical protein